MKRGRKPSKRRGKAASAKGWETRRKRARAVKAAQAFQRYHASEQAARGVDVDVPDRPVYAWDKEVGWEPPGGWQGTELGEEISFMTHEEKIEFFEYLAEELDTTVHELFEMLGDTP